MIDESLKSQSEEIIHGALGLNYNPPRLSQYYDQWSHTYDQDVHKEEYWLFRNLLQT